MISTLMNMIRMAAEEDRVAPSIDDAIGAPAPADAPDYVRARTVMDASIEKLNSRAGYLKSNIKRDSAELFETNRILEAFLEARSKIAPADIDDTAFMALESELALPIDEAAE